MTDIVERLRERANDKFIRDYPLMAEAADAITWLRVEIEQLRAITQMPLDDYVEQLRRRLESSEAALAHVAGIMHRFKE